MIFSSYEITDKSNRNNVTRSTWCKEDIRHACTTRKAKASHTWRTVDKNRPGLGTGRAGIKHQKPQSFVDITVSASKSCKIPTVQNATKDSMAFPVPKQ